MLLNCGAGEDSWESLGLQGHQTSQSQRKPTLNIHWNNWSWSSSLLWLPDAKNWLVRKDPHAGKDWGQEEKETTEDEMVGWHYWLNGHEFEYIPGDREGQGSLACCSPWGCKESHTTEWLNKSNSWLWRHHRTWKPISTAMIFQGRPAVKGI